MHTTRFITTIISGTTVSERLDELLRLYAEAEHAVSRWKEKSGVFCMDGCGVCCERFMPDILPVEADLIAVFLLANIPDSFVMRCL